MFKTGEKIVCINPIDGLIKDKMYTVKSIHKSGEGSTFLEYTKKAVMGEMHYYFWRFRKLDYEFVKEVCAMINEDNLVKIDK